MVRHWGWDTLVGEWGRERERERERESVIIQNCLLYPHPQAHMYTHVYTPPTHVFYIFKRTPSC